MLSNKRLNLAVLAVSLISIASIAQNQPGASEIALSLKKLNTTGTVLYLAAHPDDENTRLIAWLANDKCVRTGYLSLTRGDGGQNLIGKEQGDYLGLIRTQELLAARRTDGGEQFFTRAIDFGFSKNPQETFEIWNKDSVLADVVWVIRKFRPDVVICRFGTDGSGGHGHHTASAILAEEAFDAAADPTRFPEQLQYVQPWKSQLLLWNFWINRVQISGKTTKTDVGSYNPLLGKSYGEIAAESRSMHKSQGFGVAKSRGESVEYFKILKGDCDTADIFSGTDLTWKKIKGSEKFALLVSQAQKDFNYQKPEAILPVLLKAKTELEKLENSELKKYKVAQLEQIIQSCLGLFAEVSAADFSAVPGSSLKVNVSLVNRSSVPVTLQRVEITGLLDTASNKPLLNNKPYSFSSIVNMPLATAFTNPYWLDKKPEAKGLFNVKNRLLVGMPENKAAFEAKFLVSVAGTVLEVKRPVIYKWVEPSDGEKYRSLEILPPVTANIEEKVYMFPGSQPKTVKVIVKSQADNVSGSVNLVLPEGWKAETTKLPFSLKTKGEEQVTEFKIGPATTKPLAGVFKIKIETEGKVYSQSISRISYTHIPTQTLLYEAEAKLVPLDVQKKGANIGYIPGAGDDVARCLEQMGYKVTVLSDDMLINSTLAGFDAIVVGVRAYNINERMKVYYPKLMDYISKGGNLVVQYNTNNWISNLKSDIGPYKFSISRERVTKEEAAMGFVNPAHPVLNTPNKISAADFEGWVQERGVYFANELDPVYETVFTCNDPGEKPLNGSLIVAKYGKGYFMYTGLAFFRQLPAGVPGAYRLFANIVSAGK